MSASDHLRVMLGDAVPDLAPGVWVAPGSVVAGAVRLGADASVWYASVLRGDGDSVELGPQTNVQDGCVLHADPGLPVRVGARVTVGHRAVLHGCTVEDDVLVGIGAVVLNGARIRSGSLVAAGAVVLEGSDFPPNSLIAGVPARPRRETTNEERRGIKDNATTYLNLKQRHLSAAASNAVLAPDTGR